MDTRNRLRRYIILIALVAGGLRLCAQTPSFTGNWMTVTSKLEDGTDFKVYYQLQQSGSEITGRAIYPWGIPQDRWRQSNRSGIRIHTAHVGGA